MNRSCSDHTVLFASVIFDMVKVRISNCFTYLQLIESNRIMCSSQTRKGQGNTMPSIISHPTGRLRQGTQRMTSGGVFRRGRLWAKHRRGQALVTGKWERKPVLCSPACGPTYCPGKATAHCQVCPSSPSLSDTNITLIHHCLQILCSHKTITWQISTG